MTARRRLLSTALLIGVAATQGCGGGGEPTGTGGPVEVSIVEVSPGTLVITVTEERTLAASAKAANGATLQRTFTWTTSDANVATVDGTGRVRGMRGGSVQISASTDGRNGSAAITVNNPVPSLSALSPSAAIAGSAAFTLGVDGTDFVNGATVEWNGAPRTTTWVSASRVTAALSAADIAAAGTAQVRVRNPSPGGGPSAERPFTIEPPPNPVPTITSLAPSTAVAGGAGFTLVVDGTGFVAGTVVRWNGANRATTVVSATQVSMPVTAADIATPGNAPVTVFNPAPGGGLSAPSPFTITAPVPAITSLAPNTTVAGGAVFTLTVNGSGFVATSVVRWNGTNRTTAFVSATQLTAPITAADIAAAGVAQVTVQTPAPGGGTSAQSPFTIAAPNNPVPTIVSASPPAVVTGSGAFPLTVTGTNFVAGSVVRWNGLSRATTFVSATMLTAQIGAGDVGALGVGQVTVFNPAPGGGTSAQSSPVQIVAPVTAMVSASWTDHVSVCGFRADGRGYCWGANSAGQIGNGTIVHSAVPAPVSGGLVFKDISIGRFACGVTPDGTGYCWGTGGFSTPAYSTVPTLLPGNLVFRTIDVGSHACGLTTAGAAWCWGAGGVGQLGNGTNPLQEFTPVPVSGGHVFSGITAGSVHTCGIVANGEAYCWGAASYIGRIANVSSNVPVAVDGGIRFTSINAGTGHTCAVSVAGDGYCWGQGSDGALGTGNTAGSFPPALVTGGRKWTQISAGHFVSCGVTTAGQGFCWGGDHAAQLGDGQRRTFSATLLPVSGNLTFRAISAGRTSACGVTTDDRIFCWGDKGEGLLGNGTVSWSDGPVLVAGGRTFSSIATNGIGSCGIDGSGTWCWGADPDIGQGVLNDRATPTLLPGGQAFTAVTGGGAHFCGRTAFGHGFCWGQNNWGQLGQGGVASGLSNPSGSATPLLVGGGLAFASISAGAVDTCGLTALAQLYCWGFGRSFSAQSTLPVPVATPVSLQSVTISQIHACGLTTANLAYCWGSNTQGQVGDGTTTLRPAPVLVSPTLTFASLTLGFSHTCGLTTTQLAYCWGQAGRVGDGINAMRTSPTPVSGGHHWIALAAGSDHTCGITTANATFCWGWGLDGVLGDGDQTSHSALEPIAVAAPNFVSIVAKGRHTCGRTASGAAWCWGSIGASLGDGILGYAPAPVPVNW